MSIEPKAIQGINGISLSLWQLIGVTIKGFLQDESHPVVRVMFAKALVVGVINTSYNNSLEYSNRIHRSSVLGNLTRQDCVMQPSIFPVWYKAVYDGGFHSIRGVCASRFHNQRS